MKYRVSITEVKQKVYVVEARTQAAAMAMTDYGKPLFIRQRSHKSAS
jgi:hypothetical protein